MNETQIRWSIEDAAAVNIIFKQKIKTNGPAVANHPTFGAAGGKLCNGPPGRARSPGIGDILFPDHPPNNKAGPEASPFDRLRERLSSQREGKGVSQNRLQFYHTEYQRVINNKPNFKFITNIKNFKIMKKQILILAFFVLAMMAGSLTSFGQALAASSVAVTPLSCAATATDGLHPYAGVPYVYKLTGNAGTETAADYTWWATQDRDFVTGPVGVLAAGTLPGTNLTPTTMLTSPDVLNPVNYGATALSSVAGSDQVTITWGADLLSTTKWHADLVADAPKKSTFVVGYSKGNGCADNIQVYEIDPKPNFTVAILPIDPALVPLTFAWQDTTGSANLCVDFVQSAKYNAGTFMMDMDYGKNTFFFEVGAANFVKNWTPTFKLISGLKTAQTAVLTLYSSLTDAQGNLNPLGNNSATEWTSVVATQTWATGVHFTAATPSDASNGVSVFVKVVITNLNEESLTDNPFKLAVDAQDNYDTVSSTYKGIWDMEDADCTTYSNLADNKDRATILVNPRPQLDGGTTSTSVTGPTKLIPKPTTAVAPFTF